MKSKSKLIFVYSFLVYYLFVFKRSKFHFWDVFCRLLFYYINYYLLLISFYLKMLLFGSSNLFYPMSLTHILSPFDFQIFLSWFTFILKYYRQTHNEILFVSLLLIIHQLKNFKMWDLLICLKWYLVKQVNCLITSF